MGVVPLYSDTFPEHFRATLIIFPRPEFKVLVPLPTLIWTVQLMLSKGKSPFSDP